MKPEHRYAPVPHPTEDQINERACDIAKQEGRAYKELLNLIRWPSWASDPMGGTAAIEGPYVRSLRKRAAALIREELAALPRVRIKRYKRKKKPDKTRYWTRWPTKHGQHPPARKRRGWQPPKDPPPEEKEAPQERIPAQRPSRRDPGDLLLFEVPGIFRTPDI